jgi:hypothetical protein
MVADLWANKIDLRGKTIKEVQAMCVANVVPTNWEVPHIKEGWVGKPKGMQHIFWEKGFLDPKN